MIGEISVSGEACLNAYDVTMKMPSKHLYLTHKLLLLPALNREASFLQWVIVSVVTHNW